MKKCFFILLILLLAVPTLYSCGKPLSPEEQLERDIELAERCVGEPVSALYKYIGEPNRTYYGTSCLGDGMDGELHYNGFVVYTYKTDLSEIVRTVQKGS